MNEMKPILDDDCYPSVPVCKTIAFRKVSAKVCNFRVSVDKGVPLP